MVEYSTDYIYNAQLCRYHNYCVDEDGDAMNTGNTDSVNEEDLVEIEDRLSSDEELF